MVSSLRNIFLFLCILVYLVMINSEYIYGAIPSNTDLSKLRIFLCSILFTLATLRLIINNRTLVISKTMIYFLFLIGYIIVSWAVITPATKYGGDKLIEFILVMYLAFMSSFLFYSETEIKKYYKYLLTFNLIILFLMLFFNEISNFAIDRTTIGTINPIWLARFLGEIIILLIFLIKKRIFLVFKYILIALLIIGIIFTGSKGPLFSLILAFLIVNISYLKKNVSIQKLLKGYFKILFVILCLIFFVKEVVLDLFSIDYLKERFVIENSEGSYGDHSRFNMFKHAFEYFINQPLLGNGIGSFGYLFNGYDTRFYPHNIILEIMCELGIIGLTLFIIPIIKSLWKSHKYLKYEQNDYYIKITITLLIYYFLNSLVSGDLGFSNMRLFLYIGLINHIYVLNTHKYKYNHDYSFGKKAKQTCSIEKLRTY